MNENGESMRLIPKLDFGLFAHPKNQPIQRMGEDRFFHVWDS